MENDTTGFSLVVLIFNECVVFEVYDPFVMCPATRS
jgi:hypothetical protein